MGPASPLCLTRNVHLSSPSSSVRQGAACARHLLQSLTVNFSFSPDVLGRKKHPGALRVTEGLSLYKTLQVQMLDLLDIEGLYPLYRRVERYLEEFPEER